MSLIRKPRISQVTKTLLDLGWYMSLTIAVLYVGIIIAAAILGKNMMLNSIYIFSGLQIGFTTDGLTNMYGITEIEGNEVAFAGGTFVPFWIGGGGAVMWLGILSSVIQFCLLVFVLFMLRRFVQTIIDGTPFIIQNKARLRSIGVGLIITYVSLLIIQVVHERLFLSLVEDGTLNLLGDEFITLLGTVHSPASGWILMAGLLFVVVSDAFRYGTDLQVEQDLTV
ncbi:MAG: DUF2975 domain-containing protein [Rhodothermaceae bacterium]|nr:DUF2975 domain-containing protein [Rhodothermaceae bacterium]